MAATVRVIQRHDEDPTMSLLRTTLTAGIACIAALILAAPAPALAESGSWFGGKAAVTGSGTIASQVRAVADFQAIKVSGPFKVTVRQTGREALELRADDNLLPLLETVVEPAAGIRTLHLRWKRGETIRTRTTPSVTIEVAQLTALTSQGSGDIAVEGLKTPRLALSVSGSGDARLADLTTERLDLSVAGSGDVRAAGVADQLKVSVAGSGDIRALDLKAGEVAVSIAGSGDVAVHAEKTLDVSIAGSGDVVYRGGAALKSRIAGSGSVTERR